MNELTIFHMYPDFLNLYGDIGNIICLSKRCEWRGISSRVVDFGPGKERPFEEADILFIGGGSDRTQNLMYGHFLEQKEGIRRFIESGGVVLAICGGYQLLGRSYVDAEGREMAGLGIFDYVTHSGEGRLIGNVVVENLLGLEPRTLVGFENHGGRTMHSLQPLGNVISGYGNNGEDGTEGITYKNCIGTYMHGPLLPKNPHLADHMIRKALERKGQDADACDLGLLDDSLEMQAHRGVVDMVSRRILS